MGAGRRRGQVANSHDGLHKHTEPSSHLLSHGYNLQPQQEVILLEKKPDKSIFDSKIGTITRRIQDDFLDEEISNFPGRTRRTRELNRNKFYGGIVIVF